jgi:hypothetical protein
VPVGHPALASDHFNRDIDRGRPKYMSEWALAAGETVRDIRWKYPLPSGAVEKIIICFNPTNPNFEFAFRVELAQLIHRSKNVFCFCGKPPLPTSEKEVDCRVAAGHVSCPLQFHTSCGFSFATPVLKFAVDAGSGKKWGNSMGNQNSFLLEHIQIGASPELSVVLPPK